MNLEDVTLSEIRQTQKDKRCVTALCEVPKVVSIIETDRRMVLPKAVGRGISV